MVLKKTVDFVADSCTNAVTGGTVGACLRTVKPIKTTWSVVKSTARVIKKAF